MSLTSLGVPFANVGGQTLASQPLVRSVIFNLVNSASTLTLGQTQALPAPVPQNFVPNTPFLDFFPGVSEVVGFVRLTSLGVPGNPRIASTTAPAGNASTITINADVAGDNSQYAMYYITPRVMGAGGQALLP